MDCDPAFYQFYAIMQTFRRIFRKQPGLYDLWTSYMLRYQGKTSSGPFAKLLELAEIVEWAVHPPGFFDYNGYWIDLYDVPDSVFDFLCHEAWTLRLAQETVNRKTFQLPAFDYPVLNTIRMGASYEARKILTPLWNGAFVDGHSHSKYDMTNDGCCRRCGVPDTLEHRCIECPLFAPARVGFEDVIALWPTLPLAMTHHLTPPRNPFWATYKVEYAPLPPFEFRRPLPDLAGPNYLDLFTDGRCLHPTSPCYAWGAWAVVSATHDRLIACGTLDGLQQDNSRAELQALIAAVEYAAHTGLPATLWTDGASGAEGLCRLLCNIHDLPDGPHEADWRGLQAALASVSAPLQVQHVAAHRDHSSTWTSVDEWTAFWNARADAEARKAHFLRPRSMQDLWNRVRDWRTSTIHQLRRLQDFHVKVAKLRVELQASAVPEDISQTDPVADIPWLALRAASDDDDWIQTLPANWQTRIVDSGIAARFGLRFTVAAVEWCLACSQAVDSRACRVALVEVAAYWLLHNAALLPTSSTSTCANGSGRHVTIANVMRLFHLFFTSLSTGCPSLRLVSGLNLGMLGIAPLQRGVVLSMPPSWFTEPH